MRFTVIFISLLLADLIAVSMDLKPLEYVFKPSLMLALGVYFFQQTAKLTDKKQRNRVLGGIFFSLLGDVFLMFSGGFIFGLGAFLIAHLCYISAFILDNQGLVFSKCDRFMAAIGVLAYGIVFLSTVLPKVASTLQIPILVYGLTIMTMLLTALNRWKNVETSSFQWVLIGAILFVLSDSLIAISRFVQPFPLSGIAIMLTYAAGQFLIIKGVLMKTMNYER
jgi:uncharacterized membrane protein YhhN